MTVRVYERLSVTNVNSQGDIDSLATQRSKNEAYMTLNLENVNKDDVVFYTDLDVSGGIPITKRPEGSRLIDDLEAGDIVIVLKLDRMFRNALDALTHSEDWKKRRIDLHIIELGGSVIDDMMGKMYFTLMAAFAEFEREKIRVRILDNKAHLKEKGRYLGGDIPFGYRLERIGVVDRHDSDEDGKIIPSKRAIYNVVEDDDQQAIIEDILSKRNPTNPEHKAMSYRKLTDYVMKEYDVSISFRAIKRICDRDGLPYQLTS